MASIKVIIHVPVGWALPVGWLFLSPAICLAFIFSASTQFTDQTTNESREEDVITFAEAKDDDMA